jgi:HEAT repeat protein
VLTALLDTLMHDSNVNVRLAAIDALRQFGSQQVVRNGVVQALTRQDSPMVQMALIDLVVDWREKESVDTLRILSQNQNLNEAVRERAQDGLMQLQ